MENESINLVDSNKISNEVKDLIEKLKSIKASEPQTTHQVDVQIGEVASSASLLYEKIRNSIDYRESHLLRRSAIERIILRRLRSPKNADPLAIGLIKELLRTGYIKKNSVTQIQINDVTEILNRYINLTQSLPNKSKEYFIGVAAAEIEDYFALKDQENILVNFMVNVIKRDLEKINYPALEQIREIDKKIKISVYQNILKSDLPTIRYILFQNYFPEWKHLDKSIEYSRMSGNLAVARNRIETEIKSTENSKISRIVQIYNPMFLVICDICKNNANFVEKIFNSKINLENEIEFVANGRYQELKKRLVRSITRATVFIFLTKMVVGLLIEVPYDYFIFGAIQFLPLSVNLIFPPFLMFLTYFLIKIPGQENTERLIKYTDAIIYNQKDFFWLEEKVNPKKRSSSLDRTLNIIYVIYYLMILIIIIWILSLLQYNIVSGAIFFMFLSIVSFFAFRIRSSTNEIVVIGKKESFAASMVDFLLLPFLNIGKWLSVTFSNFNIFVFILDFIIEAPFKTIIDIIEHWSEFIKEKKDDMIS